MSRFRMTIIGLAAPLLILACDKPAGDAAPSADPAKQPATTAANTATPENANPSPNPNAQPSTVTPIAEGDIVTAADFEDEAEKSITSKNYKAELSSLEAEVQKE